MQVLSLAYWKICSLNIKKIKFKVQDNDNGYFHVTELLLKNSCRKKQKLVRRKTSKTSHHKNVIPSRYPTGYLSLVHSLRSFKHTPEQQEKVMDIVLHTNIDGLLAPEVAFSYHPANSDYSIYGLCSGCA